MKNEGPMQELVEQVQELLRTQQCQSLKALLTPKNPVDVAQLLGEFTPAERVVLFRLLEKQEAVEVFECLPLEEQQELLGSFRQEQLREIVEHMSPDDRALLLDELPAKVAKKLLALLTPEEREATALILGYEENTAGRLMTTEYIDLKSFFTVAQALERIRRVGLDKETIYYCYVIDEERHLIGTVSLRQLVLAHPEAKVAELMEQDVILAHTHDDQEEAALKMQKYDLLALPVVDRENRLVGIITHDDIMDIIQEEATEDIYRLGGISVPEYRYFKAGASWVIGMRLLWVLPMILAENSNGYFIGQRTHLMESVIYLAAFIPLVMSTGGNIGSQTSSVFVRGLALREITRENALRLLWRELGIGVILGLCLGLFGFGWAYWLQGNFWVSLVVGTALWFSSLLTAFLGAFWPLLFSRMGLDPALISGPLISTAMDVFGLLIYFEIAVFILSWGMGLKF
jgi:magnesium transporter